MSSSNNLNATPEGARRLRSGQLYNVQNIAASVPSSNNLDARNIAAYTNGVEESPELEEEEEEEDEEEHGEENEDDDEDDEEEEGEELPAVAPAALQEVDGQEERYFPTLWEHMSANVQQAHFACAWSQNRWLFYHLIMLILLLLSLLVSHDSRVYAKDTSTYNNNAKQVHLPAFLEVLVCCILICDRVVMTFLGFVDFVTAFLDEIHARSFMKSFSSALRNTWYGVCEPLMILLAVCGLGFYLVKISQSCNAISTGILCAYAAIWFIKTVLDGVDCMLNDRGFQVLSFVSVLITVVAALTVVTLSGKAQFEGLHPGFATPYVGVNNNTHATSTISATSIVSGYRSSHSRAHERVQIQHGETQVLLTASAEYISTEQSFPTTSALPTHCNDQLLPQREEISQKETEDSFSRTNQNLMRSQNARIRSTMIMNSAIGAASHLLQPSGGEEGIDSEGLQDAEMVREKVYGLPGLAAAYVKLKRALRLEQSKNLTFTSSEYQTVSVKRSDTYQSSNYELSDESTAMITDGPVIHQPVVAFTKATPTVSSIVSSAKGKESEISYQTAPTQLSEQEIRAQLEAEFDGMWLTRPKPVGTVRTYRYTGRDGTVTDHLHKMIYWTTVNHADKDTHTVVVYTPQASTIAIWKQSQQQNAMNPVNWLKWGLEWIQPDITTTRDAYEDEIYSIKRAEAMPATAAASSRTSLATSTLADQKY